jgi:hypothetical protein
MGNETQPSTASPLRWLQWVLVACQAASILITWQLWQVRGADHPWPNLPLTQAVPQFGVGIVLLLSLAMILIRPVWGLIAHAVILALAIMQDEARLQPEFLSILLLLVGTLPGRWNDQVARAHLGSLWFWAGLHKIISEGYWTSQGGVFVTVYWPEAPETIVTLGCALVAVSELALGILAFIPKARRLVLVGATFLHCGVLVWLVGQSWNYAVWPWQIGIIAAAWILFSEPAKQRLEKETSDNVKANGRVRSAIAAIMLAYPMLYYANLLPPAVAWCVYSGNLPIAMLFPPVTVGEDGLPKLSRGVRLDHAGFETLNVPYPTMPSSCHRFLQQHGKEGASITLTDPRPLSQWRGRGRIVLMKTSTGVEVDVEPLPVEESQGEVE